MGKIKAKIKTNIAKLIKKTNNKGHNKDYMVALAGGEEVTVKEFNKEGYDYVGLLEGYITKFKKEWLDIL